MKNTELFDETNRATYCPEDDKLRLYVGRVPREEYEALRAEGWTSTPKQECDFVAVWTPSREDTAIAYAGIIEDEDAGPEERAADRAERFGGYLDKRLSEATGHADRYDAGPSAHGFQSKARAVRAADRHDRIATRAVNAWDKAEYWQRRTAGVISHALHVSSPSVRMGRIKTLEAELRAAEKSQVEYAARHAWVSKVAADPDGFVAQFAARHYSGHDDAQAEAARSLCEEIAGYGKHRNPADPEAPPAYYFEHLKSEHPPTVADYAAHYLKTHAAPFTGAWAGTGCARTIKHLELRLAYENQMIEAQGGRAASLEMEKGGTFGGRVIAKVNKSNTSGRVVSVAVIGPHTGERWTYGATNEPGTPYALYTIKTERKAQGSYSPPTPESLTKLAEFEAAKKAAMAAHKAKHPAPSLINPTEADAEKLQALLNAENEKDPWRQRNSDSPQSEILKLTQAEYSQISGGTYARAETSEICAMGKRPERSNMYSTAKEKHNAACGPVLCKVRTASSGGFGARRVVVLTDKPQKPLPAALWQPYAAPVSPDAVKVEA